MDTLERIQEDTKALIEKAMSNYKKTPKDRLAKKSYHETRLAIFKISGTIL